MSWRLLVLGNGVETAAVCETLLTAGHVLVVWTIGERARDLPRDPRLEHREGPLDADGLVALLADGCGALVDAAPSSAAVLHQQAAEAAARTGLPLIHYRPPPGDPTDAVPEGGERLPPLDGAWTVETIADLPAAVRELRAGGHETWLRPTYPLSLLLAGRSVLVVGGGRVARRKVGQLLAARARVRVVAPDTCPGLRELVDRGEVAHVARPFVPPDTAGHVLVFAATDDSAVNREVATAARAAGALVNCADKNWIDGDFVTPAVHRDGATTVAISTGGRNCRRARLVRENLARHLDSTGRADLLVLGTGHELADLALREPLHLAGNRLDEVGRMLDQVWGVHAFQLLDTCNRVELHAVVSPDPATGQVLERIMGLDALPPAARCRRNGFAALVHTAEVIAGLRAQTRGEEHIVAQVKAAGRHAARRGWSNGILEEWMHLAHRCARELRTAGPVADTASEIEDACIDWLEEPTPAFGGSRPAFGDSRPALSGSRPAFSGCCPAFSGCCLVVLGTGTVGTGLIRRLPPRFRCTWCYHRRRPDIPSDCRCEVEPRPLAELPAILPTADVVVGATGSETPVVTPDLVAGRTRPLHCVDLALPRDVDPAVGDEPGVTVCDLDKLKAWQARRAGPEPTADRRDAIIAGYRHAYDELVRSLQGRHDAAR